MYGLVDYSFLLLSLAIFGYVIKDIFNYYRKYSTPYDIMKPSEKFFSYISSALTVIAFGWIIFGFLLLLLSYFSPEFVGYFTDSVFGPFDESFSNMKNLNLISSEEYVTIMSSIFSGIFYLTMFSFIYIFFFGLIAVSGIISSFFEKKAICVYYEDGEKENFRRIIHESPDFFYVEKVNNFKKWLAIPKLKISKIENVFINSDYQSKYTILVKEYRNNPIKFQIFALGIFLYSVGNLALFKSLNVYINDDIGNIWLYSFIAIISLIIAVFLLRRVRNTL